MKARLLLLSLTAALATATAIAQEEAEKNPSPQDKVTTLIDAHSVTLDDFLEKARALPMNDRRAYYKENYPDSTKTREALDTIIAASPSDPAVVDAAVWITRFGRQRGLDAPLIKVLTEHHLNDPGLADLVMALTYEEDEKAIAFLKTLSEKSTSPQVGGSALYARMISIQRDPDKKEEFQKITETLIAKHPKLVIDERPVVQDMIIEQQAAKLLAIGQVAPEIIGKDVDGKEMKLSDYRGQVVVLDFWGDW